MTIPLHSSSTVHLWQPRGLHVSERIKENKQQVEACRHADNLSMSSCQHRIQTHVGSSCNLQSLHLRVGPKSHPPWPPFPQGPCTSGKELLTFNHTQMFELFDVCCFRTGDLMKQEGFGFFFLVWRFWQQLKGEIMWYKNTSVVAEHSNFYRIWKSCCFKPKLSFKYQKRHFWYVIEEPIWALLFLMVFKFYTWTRNMCICFTHSLSEKKS